MQNTYQNPPIKLLPQEKETIINFDERYKTATIETFSRRLKTLLRKYSEMSDEYILKSEIGEAVTYQVPKDRIKIMSPKASNDDTENDEDEQDEIESNDQKSKISWNKHSDGLSLEEQETLIIFNEGESEAIIETQNVKLNRQLLRYASSSNDFKHTATLKYSERYTVPKNRVSIRSPKKQLTDEERHRIAEKLQRGRQKNLSK